MMRGLPTPKIKAYALVRDANGVPKIDGDPRNMPNEIKDMLTPQELVDAVRRFEEKLNGNT